MKNILKKVSAALLLVPALAMGVSFFVPVPAVQAACEAKEGLTGALKEDCTKAEEQPSGLFGDSGVITDVINIMLFIIGILSVIMVIFGGIRYTISRGKEDEVKKAKDTILYSIVGLIVAIIAYALVNWVFSAITNP